MSEEEGKLIIGKLARVHEAGGGFLALTADEADKLRSVIAISLTRARWFAEVVGEGDR